MIAHSLISVVNISPLQSMFVEIGKADRNFYESARDAIAAVAKNAITKLEQSNKKENKTLFLLVTERINRVM